MIWNTLPITSKENSAFHLSGSSISMAPSVFVCSKESKTADQIPEIDPERRISKLQKKIVT